jgi:hypothetical protein
MMTTTMMTMTMKKTTMTTRMMKTSKLVLGVVLLVLSAAAAQKPGQPYALIVGTVFFEDSGRLVRGASVEVKQKEGRKHWGSSTNMEGEFSLRLPAGKGVYIVEARAEGRAPDRKEVEITGDERVDIVLHLKAK